MKKFVGLMVALIAAGSLGFHWIEGWSLFDGFYMTIITITTTGFAEVHEMSDAGRWFAVLLMLGGVSVFGISIQEIMKAEFNYDKRRKRQMMAKIEKLNNHIIVCGFGRMGRVICDELTRNEKDFVVIEKREELIPELKKTNYLWYEGDCAEDSELIKVGIRYANTIVTAIDNDGDTLYTLMAAKNLNPRIQAICRAGSETARKRLTRLGAKKVIMPISSSGIRMAHLAMNPTVEDLTEVDLTHLPNQESLEMVEVTISLRSNWVHKPISEIEADHEHQVMMVVGVIQASNQFLFSPDKNYVLQVGDRVLGICHTKDAEKLALQSSAS